MGTDRLIVYLRVSTKSQGQSGLGIEAQRAAVEDYSRQHGAKLEGEYIEVESGKRNDRPELAKAVAHAKRTKSTLVVAKLDRLSRNAAFLLNLRDSGLPLVFCDMPGANELTVGIMAVVAEEERKLISKRTKDALQAAKNRGVKLGSARPGHWKGREKHRKAGAVAGGKAAGKSHRKRGKAAGKSHRKTALESYTDLVPIISRMRSKGCSYQKVADKLNGMGHTTRRGKPWNRMQVSRVEARSESNQ